MTTLSIMSRPTTAAASLLHEALRDPISITAELTATRGGTR